MFMVDFLFPFFIICKYRLLYQSLCTIMNQTNLKKEKNKHVFSHLIYARQDIHSIRLHTLLFRRTAIVCNSYIFFRRGFHRRINNESHFLSTHDRIRYIHLYKRVRLAKHHFISIEIFLRSGSSIAKTCP